MMDGVRAVLFDYGLVLTGPPDPTAWELLKLMFAAEEAPFHRAYWKHREEYDRGLLTGAEYWHSVAGEFGQTLEPEALVGLMSADTKLWTQPNEPMIAWAAALQRAGVKTGILSNLGDAMEAGITAVCAWLGDFTHRTFSHRLRLTKPAEAIYRHAAEGLGEAAKDILFIDDREENVAAARAAGMQAMRYTEQARFEREMEAAGYGGLLRVGAGLG